MHNEEIQELFRQRFLGCKIKEDDTCGSYGKYRREHKNIHSLDGKAERRHLQGLGCIVRKKRKRKTAESLRNGQLKVIRK